MLRAPGIEIVTADCGEAALRHVLRDDFAVILLDVQMPRIDGYEVAGLIRGRRALVARADHLPDGLQQGRLHVFRGYSAGAVDYVFKPIEPLILKSKVDVFVDLYRKTEEIRRQGEEERRLLMENLRVRSEKLKTEQALRRREEHQSIVLQSLPIALYTAPLHEDHRRLNFTNESVRADHRLSRRRRFWTGRISGRPGFTPTTGSASSASLRPSARTGPPPWNIAGGAPTIRNGISSTRRFSSGTTTGSRASSSACGSTSPNASSSSRTCSTRASSRPWAA